MTTTFAPICMGCTRYNNDAQTLVCAAFPQGIPMNIILSTVDHRQAVPGDNGIMFDPKDAEASRYAEMIFDQPEGDPSAED